MVFLSSPPARLLVVPLYLSGEGKSIFHSDSPWTLPSEGFSGRSGGPGRRFPSRCGPGCRTRGHGPGRCAVEPGDAALDTCSARAEGDRVGKEAEWGRRKWA